MGLTISIDGIFMVTPQPGGYRTYTTNLVNALAAMDTRHDFRLLVDHTANLALPANWRIDVLPRRGSIGFIWREQTQLSRYAVAERVNVLHAPGATGPLRSATPLVVTLYDTIEFTDPLPPLRQTKRWAMRLYSRLVQAQMAKAARHVVTISAYSKQRIVERFGIAPGKVTVTYLAPSPQFSVNICMPAASQVKESDRMTGYVLGIASAAPRKNTDGILAAYARLPRALRQNHPLVLVCTHATIIELMQAKIAALDLDDHVWLRQGVKDGELVQLYRAAGVFVFPSLEEGFGLPPLEAMACGAPVIAANTSSLPEVCGDAARLVTPTDVTALADAMTAVLTDSTLADTMREQGLLHCRQFSWEKTARATLAVYEAAASG